MVFIVTKYDIYDVTVFWLRYIYWGNTSGLFYDICVVVYEDFPNLVYIFYKLVIFLKYIVLISMSTFIC